MFFIAAIAWFITVDSVLSFNDFSDDTDDLFHPSFKSSPILNTEELQQKYWIDNALNSIRERVDESIKEGSTVAKNIIMFLGDGMSIPTITAARTLLGQRNGQTGKEEKLSFDKFPVVGLTKTYCADNQIPDSACTATAYLCGVKNNMGTIGVSAKVNRRNCTLQNDTQYHTESIASWALKAGMEVGIVTNTRITDASPAGAYAHSAERKWENDKKIKKHHHDPHVCKDIALQLVTDYPGNKFKVILGGGRKNFRNSTKRDEEGKHGKREDGRNLIKEWSKSKKKINATGKYVWNKSLLSQVDINNTDYLLGLFSSDHMPFHLKNNSVPSTKELTEIAIKMLDRSKKGYFLFVEGGRIDHGHHKNLVQVALDETIEFHKAVQQAVDMTKMEDTLIVVTSDHAHVMTFNGYSARGKNILGPSDDLGKDKVPYMTLSYANGPGFRPHAQDGKRQDVTLEDYMNPLFKYTAEVPLVAETHGGDDVAVFARGPWQNIFTGLYEQNEIPHLMAFAACIGPVSTGVCNRNF